MNRMILESILRRSGVTFTSTNDGEAAVKVFVSSAPYTFDCVLMDMRMPNLDGKEATALIRGSDREDAKSVPIIAISANAFTEDLDTARKAGINEYLTKPIDTRKLFDLLDKYWKASVNNKSEDKNE